MSHSRDDHYFNTATVAKSNKTPPIGESQSSSAFFQTGQGGRTVLPPLSSAFPTSLFPAPVSSYPYTQPRSSPNRCEYPAVYNNQWMHSGNTPASPPLTSFGYYETHADGRYPAQEYHYQAYSSSSRPYTAHADTPVASRKLPPLSTSSSSDTRDDRWNSTSYQQSGYGQVPGNADIRSSSASSYPNACPYTSTNPSPSAFNYGIPLTDMRGPQAQQTFTSPADQTTSCTPPPVSPTTGSEEPTIRKKRKRADAQQLKILNESFAKNAFPSTEERLALAKLLDMSPRSVQIWFQNKRQSTRQTRQSYASTSSQSHQGYALSSQPDLLGEDSMRSGYETSGGHAHVPRSQEPHHSPVSSHRRHTYTRQQESLAAIESRKQWPGRSY
ncbi:homeobox-domain-containing protein [Marasmius fiardii PR-910]|nr:homeobox-domain-containing protein [Marasmius fiardii PR-910]